jgi:hypothetical protein
MILLSKCFQVEWTGGKWRSFSQHYFVEPFFMLSQITMGLLIYLVPGQFEINCYYYYG